MSVVIPQSNNSEPADGTSGPSPSRSLAEDFALRFERMILDGAYAPGEQLPSERDLADQLGVSRPVVHRGLLDMAARGLVEIRPRKGAFVEDFRRNGTLELLESLFRAGDGRLPTAMLDSFLELRMLVEPEAARQAALRRTAEDLAALRRLLEAEALLVRALDAKARGRELPTPPSRGPGRPAKLKVATEPADIARLDLEFHAAVMRASGNAVYPLLGNSLRGIHGGMLETFYRRINTPGQAFALHRPLVEAIEAGDAPAAGHSMQLILKFGEHKLREILTSAPEVP